MRNVRKAAVIGAGVMGAAIAAQLANAGIPCLLLDLEGKAEEGRNRLTGTKPSPLYDPAFIGRIETCDWEREYERLAECDWVIEAVTERLDVKMGVWARIDAVWRPGMVVSSGTSGLSIDEIASSCGEELRKHAMVTHFFYPPRYRKLLEVVPGKETDRQALEATALFCRDRLGRGVVEAKDTPNFIANRIGTYALLAALQAREKYGLTIDEAEAVTGPLIGRPKSATFGMLDSVGLDTFLQACRNVRENVPDPLEAAAFSNPALIERMAERGWLGAKSGGAFFREDDSASGEDRIRVLDPEAMAYVPRSKPVSRTLEAARRAGGGTAGKLRVLLEAADRDRLGAFVRDVIDDTLCYAAEKLGEIADTPIEIDRAMRWGLDWEAGPFELWDALGVAETAARLEERGRAVPAPVAAMLGKGTASFYVRKAGSQFYYSQGYYKYVEERPGEISLSAQRDRGRTILSESGADLIDLGDDVACLEFRSSNNALGPGALAAVRRSAEEVERNWRGLVLANEGRNFCVGADLMLLLMEAENGEWEEIDLMVRELQESVRTLRRLPRPVVAAPNGKAFGGGAEICLSADRTLYAAETYFGLVETGAGLIPAGGGCLASAVLARERADEAGLDDATQPLMRLFESIARSKVSESGCDVKRLGYWRGGDTVVLRDETRIYEAKNAVLELERRGCAVPERDRRVAVGGRETAAVLKTAVSTMRRGGYISEHDARIAGKLADVLTGGSVPAGMEVSEQRLLDLEREAFLSLCGEPLTQARMRHWLATGKPLRN